MIAVLVVAMGDPGQGRILVAAFLGVLVLGGGPARALGGGPARALGGVPARALGGWPAGALGARLVRAEDTGPVPPVVPADAVQVSDNVKSCEGTATFYEHAYKSPPLGSAIEYDLIVIGLLDPAGHLHHGPPLVWLYFSPSMKIQHALVTIPGTPTEDLTSRELTERWPHVCDMLEDLRRRAGGT